MAEIACRLQVSWGVSMIDDNMTHTMSSIVEGPAAKLLFIWIGAHRPSRKVM